MALVELGSEDDVESCIVIANLLPASKGKLSLQSYRTLNGPYGVFAPLSDEYAWSTSFLLKMAAVERGLLGSKYDKRPKFSHQYYGERVREDRSGGHFFPLVVSGKRLITIPPFHDHLVYSGGTRECFVVWQPLAGNGFPPRTRLVRSNDCTVNQAKHAAGALVTRTRHFTENGEPSGLMTTVLLLQVSLFEGPPDNVKIDIYGHQFNHTDQTARVNVPWPMANVHPVWDRVADDAFKGFDRHCSPWPTVAESERCGALDSPAYAAKIEGQDWRVVFRDITEAWQLAVACQVLEPEEFQHRRTPNKRGRDMVVRYGEEHPERAGLLWQLWEQAKPLILANQEA